jgi:molybdate transport system ATP-binding protein
VVLVDGGAVLASGPAGDTLARLDLSNALADDAGVLVQGTVTRFDARYDLLHMQAAGGVFHVAHRELPVGTALRLRILARDVSLALSKPADSSILNQVEVTVAAMWPASTAAHVIVKLDARGMQLLARITRLSCDQLRLEIGKRLWAQVKAVALLSLPA